MNSKVYLGPTDSEAEQIPVRLFLPVLKNIQPTLRLPIQEGISFDIIF